VIIDGRNPWLLDLRAWLESQVNRGPGRESTNSNSLARLQATTKNRQGPPWLNLHWVLRERYGRRLW